MFWHLRNVLAIETGKSVGTKSRMQKVEESPIFTILYFLCYAEHQLLKIKVTASFDDNCLTLVIIRYVSRVKWSNPGKEVAPSPTSRCGSNEKDPWKFTMLLLYSFWDDWPIFMISSSNEQLQQQLEYTLLKHDCHGWWISKIQSDTLEERYAIKFCFKLGKNATETHGTLQTAFRPSCMNRAWDFEWHKKIQGR